MAKFTRSQMAAVAKALTNDGFEVVLQEDMDEIPLVQDKSGEWVPENPEDVRAYVEWGDWWVNRDGEVGTMWETWDITDCDNVRFIQVAHKALMHVV